VNTKERMLELMKLGVNGIISDRPDLLRQAAEEFDANGDGRPGDFIQADGQIDLARFDAQGHRGARNLRPENTLPAMEVALDFLMTTLETDTGITADNVPVLDHDPHVQAQKCRRLDNGRYTQTDEVLVKDLTVAQLQSTYVCDKTFRGPEQSNEPGLSPVTVAFAASRNLRHIYVMPTLPQLFEFVKFYSDYYRFGPGASSPDAVKRWQNADRVRFNIETKINPRAGFSAFTTGPRPFARRVARVIQNAGLEARADIQSFDFRTLLEVQTRFPNIRTVCLWGDFPVFADPKLPDSDDGTNLQDENGRNTPWLAGMYWPYRVTRLDTPFRSVTSGGFEGMALSFDGGKLYPLLERPLTGDDQRALLIHEFDLATRKYTGVRYKYPLNERGTNIGDFIMMNRRNGLIIERDGTQGDLNGFKAIYEIKLPPASGGVVEKRLAADLMKIADPARISEPGLAGDVGLGPVFAFPFVTIEDVFVIDRNTIGVLNDNNFPFSIGRHRGASRPDDNEFIIIRLDQALGRL
jgi:glycerophosphoryl diester phosphodiesterase